MKIKKLLFTQSNNNDLYNPNKYILLMQIITFFVSILFRTINFLYPIGTLLNTTYGIGLRAF